MAMCACCAASGALSLQAGAPLMFNTVLDMAGTRLAVLDGIHAAQGRVKPGVLRYVNDENTLLGLAMDEVAQLEAAGRHACMHHCHGATSQHDWVVSR